MIMQDFKQRHKSNWPDRPSMLKKIAEEVAGGLLIFLIGAGLLWLAAIEYARVHP